MKFSFPTPLSRLFNHLDTPGATLEVPPKGAPAGDLMLGASRTVVGTVVRESEQIRLKAESGKLLYIAHPSGQQEAIFTSTVVNDTVAIFENPAHDFPQRISCRWRGTDSVVARVEGPISGGTLRGSTFAYARASCLQ